MPHTVEVIEKSLIPSDQKAFNEAFDKFLQRYVYHDEATKKRVGSALLHKVLHDKKFADEYLTKEAQGELDGRIGELFHKYFGDRTAEDVKQNRRFIIAEAQRREEAQRWLERIRLQEEVYQHNPEITSKEAAKILGISQQTVISKFKQGKLRGTHELGLGYYFERNYIQAYRDFMPYKKQGWNNVTKALDKQRNDSPSDPYMTAGEVVKSELLPLTKRTIKKYARRSLIECKFIWLGNQRVCLLRVKHIHALKDNPPAWLRKSLQWHKFMCHD